MTHRLLGLLFALLSLWDSSVGLLTPDGVNFEGKIEI